MNTLRLCFLCRRLSASGPETRFCGCGRSFGGKRCACGALSAPDAVACSACGKTDALSEPTRSLDLTPLVRLLSLCAALLLLRWGLAHLPFLAEAALRGAAWVLSTTPCGLLAPVIGVVKVGLFAVVASFLFPGGARLRGWLWSALTSAFRFAAKAARLAVQTVTYLVVGTKAGAKKKDKE